MKKILYLLIMTILFVVVVEYELRDFIEMWMPKVSIFNSFIKNVLVGLSFISLEELWNINANKIENQNYVKYKPKQWHKLLKAFAGFYLMYYVLSDFNPKIDSVETTINALSIFFIVIPLLFYSKQLIKKRGDFLYSDQEELRYKINGDENNVKYNSIKSINYKKGSAFFDKEWIELTLFNGEKNKLNFGILNLTASELDKLIKKRWIINDSDASVSNKNEHVICPPNSFYFCVSYLYNKMLFETDLVSVILDEDEKLLSDDHFIFYNNLVSPEASLQHFGDKKVNDSDDTIKVNLISFPLWAQKVHFILSVNPEFNTNVSKSDKLKIKIEVFNHAKNEKIFENIVFLDCFNYNSIILMTLIKSINRWELEFSAEQRKENLQLLIEKYY